MNAFARETGSRRKSQRSEIRNGILNIWNMSGRKKESECVLANRRFPSGLIRQESLRARTVKVRQR